MSKHEEPNIIVRDIEALFNWLFVKEKIALYILYFCMCVVLWFIVAFGVPWLLGYMLFIDEYGPEKLYILFLIVWILGNLMFISGRFEVENGKIKTKK